MNTYMSERTVLVPRYIINCAMSCAHSQTRAHWWTYDFNVREMPYSIWILLHRTPLSFEHQPPGPKPSSFQPHSIAEDRRTTHGAEILFFGIYLGIVRRHMTSNYCTIIPLTAVTSFLLRWAHPLIALVMPNATLTSIESNCFTPVLWK